jgi:predicted N-acetyltransferase YhbS
VIFLACHPDSRGRGLGDSLMRAVTDRADAEGLPLFLEAAPTGVDSYYESRHGFERVSVSRMEFGPGGGFDLPLMLRRPGAGPGRGRG